MDKELKDEFSRIDNRFDVLMTFLHKHMVTRAEFEERLATLPTREDFNTLQTSVDGIARHYTTMSQELTVIGHRTSRMEGWIMKAAEKIGLDYRP